MLKTILVTIALSFSFSLHAESTFKYVEEWSGQGQWTSPPSSLGKPCPCDTNQNTRDCPTVFIIERPDADICHDEYAAGPNQVFAIIYKDVETIEEEK